MKNLPINTIARYAVSDAVFTDSLMDHHRSYEKKTPNNLEHILEEQGDAFLTKFVISLRDQFHLKLLISRRNIHYDHTICDDIFIGLLRLLTRENGSKPLKMYIENVWQLRMIRDKLSDLESHAKSLTSSGKEEDRKKIRAVQNLFGDAKQFNKLKYLQLCEAYDTHLFCAASAVLFAVYFHCLVVKTETIEPWMPPLSWSMRPLEGQGRFEMFLKDKFGEKFEEMVGVKTEKISWWKCQLKSESPWLYNPKLCPYLSEVMDEMMDHDTETRNEMGFFTRMSEAQQVQWELLKVTQPPPFKHSVLMINCFDGYLEYSRLTAGPWLMLWEKSFGLQLMDSILYHHEIYTQPMTPALPAPSLLADRKPKAQGGKTRNRKQKLNPLVTVPSGLAVKHQILKAFSDTTKVLKCYEQCPGAPQVHPLNSNFIIGKFLLEVDMIPHLPFCPKILEQWLCAALSCILEFECSTLEFRHFSLEDYLAECATTVMTLMSRTKQRLLLGMYLLARQALDFPNTDKQNSYPATIMDQIVLPCLPVLEWLCCGYASSFMGIVRYLQRSPMSEKVFTPLEAHVINESLDDFYIQHYWSFLFWLRGKEKIKSPLSDKELDLDALIKDISSPLTVAPPIPASFAIKPFSPQEKAAYDCLVVEDLKDQPPDVLQTLLLENAKSLVSLAAKQGYIDANAVSSVTKTLSGKKASKMVQELSRDLSYAPAMDNRDCLKQLLMFSTLHHRLSLIMPCSDEGDSPLDLVVRLNGELLMKEQLIRVASVCSGIDGRPNKVHKGGEILLEECKELKFAKWRHNSRTRSEDAGSKDYVMLLKDDTVLSAFAQYFSSVINEQQIKQTKKNKTQTSSAETTASVGTETSKLEVSKTILKLLMAELNKIEVNIKSWNRDWLWHQFYVTTGPTETIEDCIAVYGALGEFQYTGVLKNHLEKFLLNIAKDSFAIWEAGGESFPKRLECMYFLRSFLIVLMSECSKVLTVDFDKVKLNSEQANKTENKPPSDYCVHNEKQNCDHQQNTHSAFQETTNTDITDDQEYITLDEFDVQYNPEAEYYDTTSDEIIGLAEDETVLFREPEKCLHNNEQEQAQCSHDNMEETKSYHHNVKPAQFSYHYAPKAQCSDDIMEEDYFYEHYLEEAESYRQYIKDSQRSLKNTEEAQCSYNDVEQAQCSQHYVEEAQSYYDNMEEAQYSHDNMEEAQFFPNNTEGFESSPNNTEESESSPTNTEESESSHDNVDEASDTKQGKSEETESCCHGCSSKKASKKGICDDCRKKKSKKELQKDKQKREQEKVKKLKLDEEFVVSTTHNGRQRNINLAKLTLALIVSYEEEYLKWKESNKMRVQKGEKNVYDVEIVKKQFDNKRVQADAILTEHYVTRTQDLLRACALNNLSVLSLKVVQDCLLHFTKEKNTINLSNYPVVKSLVLNPDTNPVLSIIQNIYKQAVNEFHLPSLRADLKITKLSPIFFISHLLADFTVMEAINFVYIGCKDAPIDIPYFVKLMAKWRSELMKVVAVSEKLVPGEEFKKQEEVSRFIEVARTSLTLEWKVVCQLRKHLSTWLCPQIIKYDNPEIQAILQNFIDDKLSVVAAELALPSGKNVTSAQSPKPSKSNPFCCLNCPKNGKKNVELFIPCKLCKEQKIRNIQYYCSEECQDEFWEKEHAADHLGHDLGLLKL